MITVNMMNTDLNSKAGGGLADLYDTLPRGIAVAGFASATFLGPVLGPIGELLALKQTVINAWAQLTMIQLAVLSQYHA